MWSGEHDSSIDGCLDALHYSCPEDVVNLTAADLVDVFPHSLRKSTKSQELKVNINVPSIVLEMNLTLFSSYPVNC
ncbi:hypothetical protein CerSpe_145840 [Prunus speciosa]